MNEKFWGAIIQMKRTLSEGQPRIKMNNFGNSRKVLYEIWLLACLSISFRNTTVISDNLSHSVKITSYYAEKEDLNLIATFWFQPIVIFSILPYSFTTWAF